MNGQGAQQPFQAAWGVQILPLALVLGFILTTILVFIVGPMLSPFRDDATLRLFLAAVMLAITVGYGIGVGGTPAGSPIPVWRWIVAGGGLLSFALLFPSAYYYAEHMPWQLVDAIRDQGGAYRGMAERLQETEGQRGLIAIARAVFYPLIFAVLPLCIIRWRQLTWRLGALGGLAVLSSVVFSLLRGTDREVFDIMIVGGAAVLIAIGREAVSTSVPLRRVIFQPKLIVGTLVALVALTVMLGLFIDRRLQRNALDYEQLDQTVDVSLGWGSLCVKSLCPDPYHASLRPLGPVGQYTAVTLSAYLSASYHGLALALQNTNEASSTRGIGHSQMLLRVYETITNDTALYQRGYTYRLKSQGWDDGEVWSTIFPWIANDVGFVATIGVMGVLAFLFGAAWRDAVGAENDIAAVVFCFLFQLFIYVPANNQLAQTLDAYFGFVCWLALWALTRRLESRKHFSRPSRAAFS